MKLFNAFLLVFLAGGIACNNKQEAQQEKIEEFINGVYVRAFEGEYSKGNDTLFITRPEATNNYYIIQHKASYQKIREGRILPVEYKSENWTAIFDKGHNVMVEQKKGKLLSFLPDENALLLGSSRFEKIK